MTDGLLEHAVRRAEKFIDDGNNRAASDELRGCAEEDASGKCHMLIGLAAFQLEDYAEAARHLDLAVVCAPGQADWREAGDLARANAAARIHVPVPALEFFERDALLEPADGRGRELPSALPSRRRIGVQRLLAIAGDGIGAAAGVLFRFMTEIVGRLGGYRGAVWTNWYRRPRVLALLTLAHMRDRLNRFSLKPVYPAGVLTGFQRPGQTPPPGTESFRTADGSWNNPRDPMEGAAGTRFSRNVGQTAIRPETGERLMTPNPRDASRRLLTRGEAMQEAGFLNLFAAAWIQFQTHDWVSHGENRRDEQHVIPLSDDDPLRRVFRRSELNVGATQSDPTRQPAGEETAITFVNEVTHWWDGSQIYGSDRKTCERLRAHVDGKMALDPGGRLPLGDGGVEDTGFVRNWWVGLSLLHTLFVREHNAICDRLKTKYPQWHDDRMFNVARLINAAVMAKIHTIEWTPAILPNATVDSALNANWYGLATNFLRPKDGRKTVSEINIRQQELGGVVGNALEKHGVPFSLTEEFVEVYRLHSMLPETLDIRNHRDDRAIESVPLSATRQAGSNALLDRVPIEDLIYSFGTQHPGALVLNNYPKFMQAFSVPGNPLLDLGAVDILRARERGVPRYNEFRRQLQLNPIRRFEDLTDDADQIAALDEIYDGDVESLDLLIGTLAESPSRRPTAFGFGETLFQIFILNATRRLQADRFYTTCYTAEIYTPEGLAWIDGTSFKTVLLRHFPALAGTGLANICNAFEPWDAAEQLDRDRHPLRAFDRTLAPDPWKGDRYKP